MHLCGVEKLGIVLKDVNKTFCARFLRTTRTKRAKPCTQESVRAVTLFLPAAGVKVSPAGCCCRCWGGSAVGGCCGSGEGCNCTCVRNCGGSQADHLTWFQRNSRKVLRGGMETRQRVVTSLKIPDQPACSRHGALRGRLRQWVSVGSGCRVEWASETARTWAGWVQAQGNAAAWKMALKPRDASGHGGVWDRGRSLISLV